MLPAYRTEGEAFSIPKFELTPQDVDGFLDELRAFHHHCRASFERREPREHFCHDLVGPCSTLKRTAIEPMALHVEGGNIRGRQRCMSDDVWDEDHMRQTYHGLVADEMGDPDGVLMFDESGFVKKGKDAVGVARQSCGTLGKVEHSQGGVFAADASRHGSALVDTRLCMPEQWCTEDDKDSRDKCNVPKAVTLHTKPQLAVEMLQAIRREHRLPCKYIVADCLYGKSPGFLDALNACVGVTALVSMPAETRCGLQRPLTTEKTSTDKGEGRAKRVVAPETQAPVTVEALAQSFASSCWYRRTVSEGTKGPIVYECARQRVTLSKEGLPDRTGWLVSTRTLGASPTSAYSFSNAPARTPWRLCVWLRGGRWAIAQGCEETKTALGRAHDEVRQYPGWQHHILTCM